MLNTASKKGGNIWQKKDMSFRSSVKKAPN